MLTMRRTVAEGVSDVHRARGAEQHGPDGDAVAGGGLQQVESDVRGVQRRHHQQVRLALQPRVRERRGCGSPRRARRRRASRRPLRARGASGSSSSSALRILSAVGVSAAPKFECDSSATLGAMPKRRISSAASTVISAICSARRVEVDVGVADEHRALRQQQHVHRRVVLDARAPADHVIDEAQVAVVAPDDAAQHARRRRPCASASRRSACSGGASRAARSAGVTPLRSASRW